VDARNPVSAESYECLEHGLRFDDQAAYLAHRTADHLDAPAPDRDEIPERGEVARRAESAMAEQSDASAGLEERLVSYGQTEDHPARLEHDDPLERDVHRAPAPADTNR